ncbi:MAG: hypothetical protein ACRD1F_01750 [Terriglobales bacterium]
MSFGTSKTSTVSKQQTNVSELNLQDTGGITVADNAGPTKVYNIQSDAGAIAAGTQVAGEAIGANSDVSRAAISLGSAALASGAQIANAGLDNAEAAQQSALTFGNNALDTVQSIISQTQSQQEQLVGDALAGYQSIAQQNSASNSTQIQKVALYAIAALVAILVLPKLLGDA